MNYYLKYKHTAEELSKSINPDDLSFYNNLVMLGIKSKIEEFFSCNLKSKQFIKDFLFSYYPYPTNSDEKNILSRGGVFIKTYKHNLSYQENKKNSKNEYIFLNKLKTYKNYFLEPYSIKHTGEQNIIRMKEAKCSLIEIKHKIIAGNKILLNERWIKIILQQIIEAYAILKKERIVHSDVHPGNILIGFDDIIKLCDFEFSYIYSEVIEKNNEPLSMPSLGVCKEFLAPELFFWSWKLSDKDICIRYDPFKSDIFSIGLCILFLVHSDFKDAFDVNGFNNYNFGITDKAEIKIINKRIQKLFELGTKNYKLDYPLEYADYMKYALRLQKKINEKIKSLEFKSIKKILRKMMTVHFSDREDIEILLASVKMQNFE